MPADLLHSYSSRTPAFLVPIVIALACALLAGCGGGASGGAAGPSRPPQPTPSIANVSPSHAEVGASVQIHGANFGSSPTVAFNGTVAVVANGSTGALIQTTVPQGATTGTITVTTPGGSATSSGFTVDPPVYKAPANRTAWSFVDGIIDAGGENFYTPQYAVFDPAHGKLFVTVHSRNEVLVFDAASKTLLKTFHLITPEGLDLSPDNSTVVVGTASTIFYTIDTARLNMTGKFDAAVGTVEPFTLSNGKIIFIAADGLHGANPYLWDPSTGQSTQIQGSVLAGIGSAARSTDHSAVFFSSYASDVGVERFDVASGTFSTVPSPQATGIIERTATNPVKDQVALSDLGGDVGIYNGQGQLVTTIVAANGPWGATHLDGIVFSGDGTRLYVFITGIIEAFDTTTWQKTAVISQPYFQGGFATPLPLCASRDGMVYGVNDDGVTFMDLSAMAQPQSPPPGPYDYGYGGYALYLPNPTTGPVSGFTPATANLGAGTQNVMPTTIQAFIGGRSVQNLHWNPTSATFSFNTPEATQPGPADFLVETPDNGSLFIPGAFSYGPSITRLITTLSAPEGGARGEIAGYGLGKDAGPIQVSVGGQPAADVKVADDIDFNGVPRTPIHSISFQIPPGQPGLADVTVTTASGSSSLTGALRYTQPSLLIPGSPNLQAGVYDSQRHVIYYTDGGQIDVLDVLSHQWKSPIPVPHSATARLVGISLSPSGNLLAAGDQGNTAVVVLNPDNPSASIKSYPVSFGHDLAGLVPTGLAVTNEGMVYMLCGFPFTGVLGQSDRCDINLFWSLDTVTGKQTAIGQGECADAQNRVLLSRDESAVFVDFDGQLSIYDVASAKLQPVPEYNFATSDMAISADGSHLFQNSSVYGPAGYVGDPAWPETIPEGAMTQRFGVKLDRNGSLLFQPFSGAVDIVDTGQLAFRERIPLSQTISPAFDTFAWDDDDDTAFLIVSGGVLMLPLTPMPLALTGVTPGNGGISGGSLVQIDGSGFAQGMTALVDGTQANVTVVDEHHATLVMPAHAAGMVSISLKTVDGRSCALDAAYAYQTSSSGTGMTPHSDGMGSEPAPCFGKDGCNPRPASRLRRWHLQH